LDISDLLFSFYLTVCSSGLPFLTFDRFPDIGVQFHEVLQFFAHIVGAERTCIQPLSYSAFLNRARVAEKKQPAASLASITVDLLRLNGNFGPLAPKLGTISAQFIVVSLCRQVGGALETL
jgi:hypothetical protein